MLTPILTQNNITNIVVKLFMHVSDLHISKITQNKLEQYEGSYETYTHY